MSKVDADTTELLDAVIIANALGNPMRMRIVEEIALRGSPVGIGHLARMLATSSQCISNHLRILRGMGILESNRGIGALSPRWLDGTLPGLSRLVRLLPGRKD